MLVSAKSDLAKVRAEVGMVFQSFNLFPHMTVLRNVALAPVRVRGLSWEDANERARKLLVRVGLEAQIEKYPSQLSGGQQQRVGIARALVVGPRVILADEPTGNLDSQTGADVIELLAGLASSHGATVIVATHDADLAARAPRRLAMRDGRLAHTLAAGAV
jgi:predicted ABC-type transport system involved in lysophospholipase L1 biosynthesis ATPase subunit